MAAAIGRSDDWTDPVDVMQRPNIIANNGNIVGKYCRRQTWTETEIDYSIKCNRKKKTTCELDSYLHR